MPSEKRVKIAPCFVAPMLCREVEALPRPGDWFYEVKREGHRAVAIKNGNKVSLLSEHGTPLDYPEVRDAVQGLPVRTAVVDCELVSLDPCRSSCTKRSLRSEPAISLYAFDLLFLNGRNIIEEPIEKRKERLCSVILSSSLLFSPSLSCEPEMLVDQVKQLSLGGVVAKRRGSCYQPGQRSGSWLKMRVDRPGAKLY